MPKNQPKKRRKAIDPSYRRVTRIMANKLPRPDILAMRTEKKPTKMSIMTKDSGLMSPLQGHCGQIESHTPIAAPHEYSENGSVTKVISKNSQTILHRVLALGSVNLFSSNLENTLVEEAPSPIKQNTSLRTKELHITPTSLEKAIKENETLGRRSRSQNSVMGESANQAAQDIRLSEQDNKWEWLHLIAHSIGGDSTTQNKENLVGGTNHANTNMIFIESQIPRLLRIFPDGLTLRVSAEFIENTEIACKIKYEIMARDGFHLEFLFDAQAKNKPHIDTKEYIDAYIASYLSKKEDNTAAPTTPLAGRRRS